jgi:zinc protease
MVRETARPPPDAAAVSAPETPALPEPPPLQFHLLPDPDSALVVLRVVFRTGSVDDPLDRPGLTHLTARLMAQATNQLSARQLAQAFFPLATSVRAFAARETVVFSVRAHKEVARRALDLMLDTLSAPALDAADLERLRTEERAWLESGLPLEDDEALGHAVLDAALWEGHPYAHATEGTVASVKAITLSEVQAHRQRFFTQARALVGLGGAVDDALVAHVRSRLAGLPRGNAWEPAPLPPVPPPFHGLRVAVAQRPAHSTPITLGYRWDITRAHPDFVALWVANSALGEHRTLGGRLFARVREQRGLNYGAYSYLEHFEEEGEGPIALLNIPRRQQAFRVWLRPVPVEDSAFALRLALRELHRFAAEGLTEKEFQQSRDFLQGAVLFQRQGLARRVAWALDDVLNGTPGLLNRVQQELATLTVHQVNAAVARHVRADGLTVSLVLPDGAAWLETLTSPKGTPRVHPPYTDPALLAEDAEVAVWPVPLAEGKAQVRPAEAWFAH